MRLTLRFTLILVAGLALLTAVAYLVLSRTARDWFEADVAARTEIVVRSARSSLVEHWSKGDLPGLRAQLKDIARSKRVMAVAACSPAGATVAVTDAYPSKLWCPRLHERLMSGGVSPVTRGDTPFGFAERTDPNGEVYVTIAPLWANDELLGTVVLVNDLSFVGRREITARNIVFIAFGVIALLSSVVTVLAARFAWRGFRAELIRMLRGGREHRAEYQPLMKDVRALVQRLAAERDDDQRGGRWTPERLKASLGNTLRGERVVVVANREPYIHERGKDGKIHVQHPASGLVTALEPVLRACSGVWIAHGGGSADRETADSHGRVSVPPGEESYVVRRVWLSEAEEQGYYYGFSNEGLWPLCHLAHTRPTFRAEDFEQYKHVNQKFADAVCQEVDSDDPIILVQDYHFALAPKMIRKRLPRAAILTFWHIPWPNAEYFGICPWRVELLEGLLGSSILGFHTQLHCNNFLDSVDTFIESRIDRERNAVVQGANETLVRPYPISTEWPIHWLEHLPPPEACRRSVFAELGLREDALLGVGVDRLDYTKGIEERLLAVERMLEKYPSLVGRFTFVQLAAPSRIKIARYQALSETVHGVAKRINERYGNGHYRPIILLPTHHEPPQVFRFYRAADVCYVSSLHDGMNLVAKEFVASRDDELGALVLSHFTGAARELTEALIVNPYDLDQAADALAAAVHMPQAEQRERMRSMRRLVAEFNVYRWAGRMLFDAAQLRRRERLSGRIARLSEDASPQL